ncbi:MAG: DUF4338 domain-containing protein [Candidatus Schekmanbacteria bacterium]|nr:DUF4338 domain-containing protein [Candidatus Schekmanbacteria bacterium]
MTRPFRKVITNARFLSADTVVVPDLASCVLGHRTRRMPRDWHQRYSVRSGLVETCVDPECYQVRAVEPLIGSVWGKLRDGIAPSPTARPRPAAQGTRLSTVVGVAKVFDGVGGAWAACREQMAGRIGPRRKVGLSGIGVGRRLL